MIDKKANTPKKAPVALAIDGAAVERFKSLHGLTVADSCSVLGIATPHKFGEVVRKTAEEINLSLAFLVRYYNSNTEMVPKIRPMELIEAYEMFQGVMGKDVLNESVFAALLGRTPGSGYRWIRQNGRATPQVARILDRFSELRRQGKSDKDIVNEWIEIARTECRARNRDFILDKETKEPKPRKKRASRKSIVKVRVRKSLTKPGE